MQQITVRVELGGYVLVGREVEFLEIVQRVGEHVRCVVSFDRDPTYAGSPLARVRVAELADAELRVTFSVVDPTDATSACVAFAGQVREAEMAHQPTGAGRFTVVAVSRSYELAEHVARRYLPAHDVSAAVRVLGGRVAGSLPGGAPRDYVQPGQSAWGFLARLAAGEGLQLRPVWPRTPDEAPGDEPVEVGRGFTAVTHTLTWGRDLVGLTTALRPTNPGVTGAFYDPAAKHDHRFRGVRAQPAWLGGAAPLVAAAERRATADAGGGDPGHVDPDMPAGGRARTLTEYRDRLERASARRLGGTVIVTGQSVQPALRAGDQITVAPGGGAAALVPGQWGSGDADAERSGTFGLVSVTHRWTGTLYENAFVATPWAEYHPEPPAGDETRADAAARGLALGIVVENADPEGLGRVRVRYPWMGADERTTWVRVAAPGAGNGRGLGLLPSVGDEVVLAAVDGDPEHVVVLGSVWNGMDRAAHAPQRQHWVTPAGNTLVFHEDRGAERVELYSPTGACWVQLAAKGPTGVPTVTVHSEGDLALEAPNGQLRLHAGSLVAHVGGEHATKVGGKFSVDAGDAIGIASGGNLGLSGKGNLTVSAGGTLHTHAGSAHAHSGAPMDLDPGGGGPPPVKPTVPGLPGSAWGSRPVPAPGPGRSTEDPETPTLRQLAARSAPAAPPPPAEGAGAPAASDAVGAAAGLGAAAAPARPDGYGPQAEALRRAAVHGTPLQEVCA
jgi:phage baseplate assembly protein gpV